MDTYADKCAMFKDCFKDNTLSFRYLQIESNCSCFIQTTAIRCILLYRQILLVEDKMLRVVDCCIDTHSMLQTNHRQVFYFIDCYAEKLQSDQQTRALFCRMLYTHARVLCRRLSYTQSNTVCCGLFYRHVDCYTDNCSLLWTFIQKSTLYCILLYGQMLCVVFCDTDKYLMLYTVLQTNALC